MAASCLAVGFRDAAVAAIIISWMPMMRSPADGDADAETIIELACGGVAADLLACLDDRDFISLGPYGGRQRTAALRQGSAEQLRDVLLAAAICELGRN
jgi:hypothetical protein